MKITGMKQRIVVALVAGLSALVGGCLSRAYAQSTTGSIYGTVSDPSGGLIPDAAVTAKNVQNGFTDSVKTNANGGYVFPTLAPGNYIVTATATGFNRVTQTGVVVDANQNVHVLFSMPVGSNAEQVTVTAGETLVDTREGTLATTIDQARLQEMPVPTRDPYSLISLAPGVQGLSNGSSTGSGFMGDNVGTTFSTNGMRVYENSYFLDGADFLNYFKPGGNIPPDTDALQEIRVITSNSDAEFGTMPGAVVNMISSSGTNRYHGLLFEYIRNTIFNARTEFQAPPGHLRQNVFGGNFGGPVLHDRLFGFFSYQGVRIATNTTLSPGAAIVPTAAERVGDFSGDSVIPTCGAKTYPCPGQPGNPNTTPGIIPAAYLDPVVQNMLKFIPVGTTPATKSIGGPTPLQVANSPVTDNQYLGRADYQVTSKQKLSYIYVHNFGENPSPTSGGQTVLGYAGDLLSDAETNHIVTHTWTVSGNLLNTVRGYYTGSHYVSGDLFPNTNLPSQLGITAPCGGDPCTQPNVRMAGFIASFGNSGSAPTTIAGVNVGFGDTFIWIRGAHTLKLGTTVMRSRFDYNTIGQREGIYTIGKGFTNNNLADFLLGKSSTFNQSNGSVGTESFHRIEPAIFVQDDWKLGPRFTLDLGLRWETFPPVHGMNNTGSFAFNVQSKKLPTAPLGVLFNGDDKVPDGVLNTSYAKLAPRIGFGLDVFGDGKTSLRGAFGIFYSQVAETWFYQLSSPLFNESIALTNTTSFANPYAGSTTLPVSPFPYTPNLTNPTFGAGLVFTGMPYGNKSVPYALEYNLTMEHQFSSHWAGSIAYVGNGTRRFYGVIDENAPVYSPSCTAATCSTTASILARRPYKPAGVSYVFNAMTKLIPEASGSFDSLQASLTKRLSHGFSINANYVWEKAISVAADPTNNSLTLISSSNNYDLNADRGKASTMVPQSFKVSYLWVSPEVHRWGLFGREILSGWSFNGITTIRTGTPLNVVSGSDTNFDGTTTTDRPNQIADWRLAGGRSRAQKEAAFFNTAAFAAVPVGTTTGLGTTQFDTIIGSGSKNTDLAGFKSFHLYKEHKILFRAEAYNLFNNVNLGNPGVSLSSPASFGKITSAAPGRIMQFAVRYSF